MIPWSGAREFIEAGKITGILTTIGVECRVSMKNTPLADKRINNPDQKGIAYTTIHGIPHQHIDEVVAFFKPYVKARNERNRKMTDRINTLTAPYGIRLDFDRDVVPLSEFVHGGSITERPPSVCAFPKAHGAFWKRRGDRFLPDEGNGNRASGQNQGISF